MTFLKKNIVTPITFIAMAASVQAIADPIEHTIMLQATVPTSDFYVLPSDQSWIGNTQELSYNPITEELSALKKSFDVLNTGGSITAQLTSTAMLSSSTDNIPLNIKFNGKDVETTPVEVVAADEAKTPRTVNLEIIPVKSEAAYKPGKYTGNVHLSFDAKIKDKPAG